MIQSIHGTVRATEGSTITIEVSGIGFACQVTHPELYALNAPAALYTYFHWHQENGPQLFGFATTQERQLFGIILTCAGIGPKVALSLITQCPHNQLAAAIALGDVALLSSLKGIGLKKAESIVLQLQSKMKQYVPSEEKSDDRQSQLLTQLKNVSDVLSSLNYSRQEISQAIDHLKTTAASSQFDELVRKALAYLSKARG